MPDFAVPAAYAAQLVRSPVQAPFPEVPPPPPRPRPSASQMYTGQPPLEKKQTYTMQTANGPVPFEPDSVTHFNVYDDRVFEC